MSHSLNFRSSSRVRYFFLSLWILTFFFSVDLLSLQMECPFGCGGYSDPSIIQIKRHVYGCFKDLAKQSERNSADPNKCTKYKQYRGPNFNGNPRLPEKHYEDEEDFDPRFLYGFCFEMDTPTLWATKNYLFREWKGNFYRLAVDDLKLLTLYGLSGKFNSSRNQWESDVEIRRKGTGLNETLASGENYFSHRSYGSMLLFFERLEQDLHQLYAACINQIQRGIDTNTKSQESLIKTFPKAGEYSDPNKEAPCLCRRFSDYTCSYCGYRRLSELIEKGKRNCEHLYADQGESLQMIQEAHKVVLPLYLEMYDKCIKNHEFAWASYQRGLLNFHDGNFVEAWDDIQDFFEKNARQGDGELLPISILFDKGLIESELGLYNNAIASLSQVIERDPSNKMAYFERAAAYFGIGNFDAAFSDFLRSDLQKTASRMSDLDYAKAVLSGLKKGSINGAEEFIPALLASVKGMSTALWNAAIDETAGLQALISDPTSYLNLFLSLLQDYTTDLSHKAKELIDSGKIENKLDEWGELIQTNSLSDMVSELDQLAHQLLIKDPSELGEQVGYIIGKYGTDALAWYGVLKLPRALNFANKALTLELGSESAAAREVIVSQAIEKQGVKELISAESCAHRLVNANKVLIQEEKLTKYALDFTSPKGKDKAIAFETLLGFNQKNYKELIAKIEEGVKINTPVLKEINQYGISFQVDMILEGPKGSALVRTGWIYDPESTIPRMTSAYPKKSV